MEYIRRLYIILKPFWRQGIFLGLLTFANALIVFPTPFLTKYIIDDLLPQQHKSLLISGIFGLFILQILFGIYGIWFSKIESRFNQKLFNFLKYTLISKLEKIKFSFFMKNPSETLMNRFMQDLRVLNQVLFENISGYLITISQLIFGLFSIFYLSPELSILTIMTIPIYILANRYFRPLVEARQKRILSAEDTYLGVLKEFFVSIKIIKLYIFKNFLEKHFKPKTENLSNENISYTVLSEKAGFWIGLARGLSPLLLLAYGGILIMDGKFSIGGFFAFNSLSNYVIQPINTLFSIPMTLSQVQPSLERVFEVLDAEEEKNSQETTEVTNGEIIFEDVSLSLKDTPVLSNISFNIPSKSFVVITGESGSGKSSLLRLLGGLYEASSGTIQIDGKNIQNINIEDIRKSSSHVLQENILITGSILENITLGKDISPEKINEILESTDMKEAINALQKGLETEVSEENPGLSGGQIQRLCIARALVHGGPLLFLDEPTSALDAESQKSIENIILKLKGTKTIIMVTHHTGLLENADMVIKVNKGKII